MKRFLMMLTLCMVITGAVFPTEDTYASKAYVVDDGDLLSDSEESKLKETLSIYSDKWDCDIVVLTEYSLNGSTPRNFADDYYDYNGYSEDGLLLLISMENRDWYITTSGDCIDAFTDAGIQYIGEQITPDLGSSNYYSAFDKYADLCDQFLEQASKGKPYDTGYMPVSIFARFTAFCSSLATAAIGGLITVFGLKAKNKTVRHVDNAKDYIEKNSLNLTRRDDVFLYSNVTKVRIETDSGSRSSGGGGSSVHHSSSGHSHGGGGGHF